MHTRNVEYLAVCLHLWLAISYSAVTTRDMANVSSGEGETAYFPWNVDTQNLRKVQYVFRNEYIAKSFSPNFSSVIFIDETMEYRLRVLADDKVAFQIDNVTTEDSGEYKIILIYINGDTTELIGRLDVTGERTTIPTPTPTGERTTIPTPTGETIAIVLGVLITVGVIVFLAVLLYWRRKKRAVSEKPPVNAQYGPVKRSSDATNDTCNRVKT